MSRANLYREIVSNEREGRRKGMKGGDRTGSQRIAFYAMLFRLVTAHYIRLVEYASSRGSESRELSMYSKRASLSFPFFLSFFFPPIMFLRCTATRRSSEMIWKAGWKLQLNLQAIAICDGTATFGQPWQTNGRKRNVIEERSGRVTIPPILPVRSFYYTANN